MEDKISIGALKDGLREKRFSVDELMRAADADRMRRVVMPYVEGYFGFRMRNVVVSILEMFVCQCNSMSELATR